MTAPSRGSPHLWPPCGWGATPQRCTTGVHPRCVAREPPAGRCRPSHRHRVSLEKGGHHGTDHHRQSASHLYSALCTEGSVRSELSSTFTVYQPHYPVCAAASTGIGSPGLALNHVGGTRGATRWTLSSTIDANLTS